MDAVVKPSKKRKDLRADCHAPSFQILFLYKCFNPHFRAKRTPIISRQQDQNIQRISKLGGVYRTQRDPYSMMLNQWSKSLLLLEI